MSNQRIWVLLLFVMILLQNCNQSKPTENNSFSDSALAPDSSRGGVTLVIEDLDPSRSRNTDESIMIIAQSKLQSTIPDSSKVIILNDSDISTSGIYKSGENYFIITDNGNNYPLLMESGKSDTLRTSDLETYHAIRAIMNGDTVRLFLPRTRLIEMNNQ
ncbi:MAG: hypothetical protein SFU99_02385 [Saprospiraceae bacterium]|nr:hypothetical protein [Saprospiraceae bacterium]